MAGIIKKIQLGLLLGMILFMTCFMKANAETGELYGSMYDYNPSTQTMVLNGGYFTGVERFFSTTAYDFYSPFESFPEIRRIEFRNVTFGPDSCKGLCSAMSYLWQVEFYNCDTSRVTSMQQMFNNCPSLSSVVLNGIDSTSVSDFKRMFSYSTNLKQLDLSSLSISSWADTTDMLFRNELESITAPSRVDKSIVLGATFVDPNGNNHDVIDSSCAGKYLVRGTGNIGPALIGFANINGEAVVGQTLTTYVSSNNTATLKYQWMRDDDVITGATASSYVVQKADVGHYLYVVIRSTYQTGSITSHKVGKVVSSYIPTVEITLTTPVAGQAPSDAQVKEGSEYTITSTTWNPSDNVFASNTTYTATIVVSAKQGESFSANTDYMVNGKAIQPQNIASGFVTISVTFGKLEAAKYIVNARNSKATDADGNKIVQAAVGSMVIVIADAPEKGMVFDKWQVSGVNISNITSSTIRFAMPDADVSLLATYKKCDHSNSATKATCYASSVCSICGDVIPKLDHDYSNQWFYDAKGHWRVCRDCGTEEKVQEHVPGPAATENTPQVCKVCGYVIKPALSHKTHNLKKVAAKAETCTKNGNKEYYKCNECGKMFSDNKGTKEVTIKDVTIRASHTYSNKYSTDSEYHWKECSVCHEKSTKVKHTYDLIIDADCNECGYHRNVGAFRQMKFKDVKNNGWYKDYVQYVFNYGIMNGQSDTLFGTEANITREEFVQVLYGRKTECDIREYL